MNRIPNTRQAAIVAVALLAVAGAVFACVELTRPTPFDNVMLNDQWQCTRTAGILTVCTKKPG